MIYIIYLALAAAIVLISVKLSVYVDLLDKTTNISGAFIGGVMLAAVTSLPELFTSIAATLFVNQPDLVIGNVLGSNLFNLAILGALILFGTGRFSKSFISVSHKNTVIATLMMYALVSIALIVPSNLNILGINPISIVVFLLYVYCVKNMSGDDSSAEDEEETAISHLSKKQILVRFAFQSVLLVIVSIALTLTTDIIATKLNLGMTFAGALLLGVATSLPELASSISLVRLGNFNATTGNIVGSNLFNFSILFIADLLYSGGSIYTANSQLHSLLFFGVIAGIAGFAILHFKSKTSQKTIAFPKILYTAAGAIPVISYILFLQASI
ncbi:sodium:calcium antiporter [Proteocatella sphenisci]|uniref:sodium:calcium antiporter n=1 Tax=Proteocatella sphenisci TaxID=181070 RepID=UPI00048F6AC6|nr:hypothetical protein [Proteocatella sphenisci]